MTASEIRLRLARAQAHVEISVLDPDCCPQEEWWLQATPESCPACDGTGSVPVYFGTQVIDTIDCPRGCEMHPSD